MSKKIIMLKIIGFSFLIPVILYWGYQIKSFAPNTPAAMEIMQNEGQPYWLVHLKWALLPWGILISGILIPLSIGLIQLKNFWRKVTIIIVTLYLPFILIMPFLSQHWFFRATILYAICMIILFTRKGIKGEYK